MKRLILTMVPVLFAGLASGSALARPISPLEAADMRLLTVAEKLQRANAPLCDRLSPALGVGLQSTDQFKAGSDPGFAAPVAFALVLPDGEAARAGIARNDGLVAVDGIGITKMPDLADMPLRDSAYALLSSRVSDQPLRLSVMHGGETRDITLALPAECRALVEVIADGGIRALSDGRVIQIGLALAQKATDDELAVIFAHELAHSVLHHRDRLSALNVDKGLGAEFGRNRQLNGVAEIEADRLSVHLLANAGYDPRIAPAFWRGALGKQVGGGLFRSRIYSSAEGRAELLDREIAEYLSAGAPSWPGHLLARRPKSG